MLSEVTDFCRLILFRHPELRPDHASRAVGAGAAELGRRGQASVIRWLEALEPVPVDAVTASEQPQCRDPAAAIALAKGLELEIEPRLRDQDLGEWQGRAWQEIASQDGERVRRFFGDFGEVAAPGGESLGAAVERFLDWWQSKQVEALGKTVAVVASGAMITGFTAAMLGMRLSRAVSLNLPHAGFGVLDVFANGARVATWNPTGWAAD